MRYIFMVAVLILSQIVASSVYAEVVSNELFEFPGFKRIREHDAPKVLLVNIKEKIDKKTFQVILNGKKVTNLIDPRPGMKEVVLPFRLGLNEIVLTARKESESKLPMEQIHLQIMYRPKGDAVVMKNGGVSVDDTPRARELIKELMKAAHSNDVKRVQEIQLEIKNLKSTK